MPALNFQKWSAPLVESGEKRQTIRAYRKDGRDPKVGDTLYLYTGMRTKACRKLGEVVCNSAERLRINEDGGVSRHVFKRVDPFYTAAWAEYDVGWCNRIARADGFNGLGEMRRWFEKTHGLPFEGLLIKWGDIDAARDEEE